MDRGRDLFLSNLNCIFALCTYREIIVRYIYFGETPVAIRFSRAKHLTRFPFLSEKKTPPKKRAGANQLQLFFFCKFFASHLTKNERAQ